MRKAITAILGFVLFFSSLVVLVPQQSSAILMTHDPIRIDNNTEFAAIAASESWDGDGSADDPYMIRDYDISGHWTSDPIYIGNTTAHFVIDGCTLWEASTYEWPYVTASGITLNNVSNGIISNDNIADVSYDITLLDCDLVTIDSNELRCSKDAIMLLDSKRATIINNDFAYSSRGVQIEGSDDSTISNNSFLTFSEYCVVLAYSDDNVVSDNEFNDCEIQIVLDHADNNIVQGCNFSNGQIGILITESNWNIIAHNSFDTGIVDSGVNITAGTNNTVKDNSFGSPYYGVTAELAHDLTVENNTYPFNVMGVYARESDRVTIEENSFINCWWEGVFLEDSNYFLVVNNSFTACGEGILLMNSDYGEIANNNCSWNYFAGLSTEDSSYNTISDNDFSGNPFGIYMYHGDSHNIIATNNFTSNSVFGMSIHDASQNVIVHNIVEKCASFGVYLAGSIGNSVYFNIFRQNNGAGDTFDPLHPQAWDDSNMNQWDLEDRFGNFWQDWRTPDSDNNGVVDSPYELFGSGIDHYPLTSVVSHPRNLAITAGDTYANLSWDTPNYSVGSSITSYKIYRENPDGSESIIEVQGDVTVYNDTSVHSWKTYTYSVTAVNTFGEGPDSNEVGVLIPDYTKPSITITFPDDGAYGSDYSMLVEWVGNDDGSGVSHYEIMLDDGLWLNVSTDTDHTYEALSNGTHAVTVKVVDNASNFNTDSVTFKIGMGTISGRIMSEGQPVAGANVSIETGEQTTTDSNGNFTLEAFAGPHTLTVSREGYDDLTHDLTLEPGQLMDLEQMEINKSGIDLMWVIVAIIVVAAVIVLVFVVLRARRH